MNISFGGTGTSTQTLGSGIYVWQTTLTSGIIESFSSGGPLFDQNKRVIGNVYGSHLSDLISCNNPDGIAYFGNLHIAWDGTDYGITNGYFLSSMKTYLDKNNSGSVTTNSLSVNQAPGSIYVTGTGGVCLDELYTYTATSPTYKSFNTYTWTYPSGWIVQYQGNNYIRLKTPAYYPSYGTVRVTIANNCGSSGPSGITVYPGYNCGGYFYSYSPNPISDELTVEAKQYIIDSLSLDKNLSSTSIPTIEFEILLINLKQELVLKALSKSNKAIINTRSLEKGIYILHIIDQKEVIKKQVIIE